jgi:Skp family chaperone for outer membrane proteins
MRAYVRWIITIGAVLAAVPATAGGIGFLDTQRAVRSVKEGQRQMQALDAWANRRADEIEAMRNRAEELTQQLAAQRTIATDEAIRELEEELIEAERELEDAGRALQRDFEAKQRELLSQVASRVRDIAGEFAVANELDAVVAFETLPLVYVAESALITEDVIRLYDERYPLD